MDIKKYFDKVNKKVDEMPDEELLNLIEESFPKEESVVELPEGSLI